MDGRALETWDGFVIARAGRTLNFDINMDNETRRKRIEMAVKLAALGVVGFLVAPIIFVTIKGIIGLGIAMVLGLVGINLAPWVSVKVANWRLKALKHEASQNPIETLENQYRERQAALVSFRENILTFNAQVENFYGTVEGYAKKYPDEAENYMRKYEKMKSLLVSRGEKYKQAQRKLAEFSEVIEQKRAEWEIAQAAAAMSKAAGVGEDFISQLMADTALGSVQTHLNTAFAELEVSLLEEVKPDDQKVIEMPKVQKVPAQITAISGPPKLELDIDIDMVPAKKRKSQ